MLPEDTFQIKVIDGVKILQSFSGTTEGEPEIQFVY
jgi:hypothetical protein